MEHSFNQDLSERNVANGHSFRDMFRDSGMYHSIGDWDFGSMPNGVGSRRIFVSVLYELSTLQIINVLTSFICFVNFSFQC